MSRGNLKFLAHTDHYAVYTEDEVEEQLEKGVLTRDRIKCGKHSDNPGYNILRCGNVCYEYNYDYWVDRNTDPKAIAIYKEWNDWVYSLVWLKKDAKKESLFNELCERDKNGYCKHLNYQELSKRLESEIGNDWRCYAVRTFRDNPNPWKLVDDEAALNKPKEAPPKKQAPAAKLLGTTSDWKQKTAIGGMVLVSGLLIFLIYKEMKK